jgi:DNA repair exonuclease SbcCD nuclease subunit
MFNKAAVFSDLHLGLKGNSQVHNNDCEEFVEWYIQTAKQNDCETGIFCGDWTHNRNSINLTTLNTGIRLLEKLGSAFENFYMILGNHDLYYKNKRDIYSVEFAKHINGITVVEDLLVKDDVAFVPWLVGDEWKRIKKLKSKYIFGHFELPEFLMNAMVQMPNNGELQLEDFNNQKYVFSGHFHKRQNKKNIHYIGNAFPHNYADNWDDQRGMMILDRANGGKPEYFDWSDCPKYRTVTLSQLIDQQQTLLKTKMYLRVKLDIDISFEEASFIKETFLENYDCREITLITQKNSEDIDSQSEINQFESVDQIVSKEILEINSENYNKTLLLDIYNSL